MKVLRGYGKSDKPAEREDYSYERQVDWMGNLRTGRSGAGKPKICRLIEGAIL